MIFPPLSSEILETLSAVSNVDTEVKDVCIKTVPSKQFKRVHSYGKSIRQVNV